MTRCSICSALIPIRNTLERGNIEVAPLAYPCAAAHWTTAFIILDEAQNTFREQMKMFLTRIGFGSKVVITGDITQIDLPEDKTSGLKVAMKVLDGIEDIAICKLTGSDVVRHRPAEDNRGRTGSTIRKIRRNPSKKAPPKKFKRK